MDSATPLPVACPDCTEHMPESAAFCPGCGRPMHAATPAEGRVGRFPETIAGALAYFTFIPAIIFLSLEPYNRNRFARYHSIQCLLLWAVLLLTAVTLKLAGMVVFLIPMAGPLLVYLISVIGGLAAFLLWLVLVVKALQGERFKLPVLGDFAERHANSS